MWMQFNVMPRTCLPEKKEKTALTTMPMEVVDQNNFTALFY